MNSTKLQQLIDNLRATSKTTSRGQLRAVESLLFIGTAADKNYLPYLKGCVGSYTTHLSLAPVSTLVQVAMLCSSKGISRVISTSIPLLKKLLVWEKKAAPSLDNYAGSYFTIPPFKAGGLEIEVVFIKPLAHLVTVPHGRFMATRIISKLTKADKWYTATKFTGFELLVPENEAEIFKIFLDAFLVSIDIETYKENAVIRCLSYTAFFYTLEGSIKSTSVVLALDSEYALSIMRKWNWKLQAPKVMQGGMYDIAYLSRYSAPVYNYLYDTANLFHAWYSELPKDLGFLNSFFIRKAIYWKDLADTIDQYEYYRYNALDTWGTGNCFLAMLLEAPDWAIDNYLLEFPVVFPCHLAEMTGMERDMTALVEARAKADRLVDKLGMELDTIIGVSGFNVKSPVQVKALLKVLGCKDLKTTGDKDLERARFRHPFNARVIKLVIDIREQRTARERYLKVADLGSEFHRLDGTGNRILYTMKPHGTDTSRLVSRSHHFWCGFNVQNITRGPSIKCTFIADPGFFFAEADLEQNESRDTAYISGDANLIDSVENSPDFHSQNASAFFGIPFDELWDTKLGKTLNKEIRDLSKRTTHGATYNMAAQMLVTVMGEKNISKARQLLGLSKSWSYIRIAEHLLEQFHKTFPGIQDTMYAGIKKEVKLTHMLASKAVHWDKEDEIRDYELTYPLSRHWTRYCFGNLDKSKHAMSALGAHAPQSLAAQTLNKAWQIVFYDIAMHPKHSANFKLCAQIHDSILFQYREGHRYLCDMVKDKMEIPITIKGYDDTIRTFTVPAGIKAGSIETGAKYWSEIE